MHGVNGREDDNKFLEAKEYFIVLVEMSMLVVFHLRLSNGNMIKTII